MANTVVLRIDLFWEPPTLECTIVTDINNLVLDKLIPDVAHLYDHLLKKTYTVIMVVVICYISNK